MMQLPLAICGVCIVTSIIGTFFVRLGRSRNIMGALYQGLIVTGVLSIAALWFVCSKLIPQSMTTSSGLTFSNMNLFETYVVTVGATMVLTALLLKGADNLMAMMALPLLIGGVCIVTSIIGTYFVRLGGGKNIMGAMYKGFGVTAVTSAIARGFESHGSHDG
jgi:Na+/H+-translocating membrane pyrophosphatase